MTNEEALIAKIRKDFPDVNITEENSKSIVEGYIAGIARAMAWCQSTCQEMISTLESHKNDPRLNATPEDRLGGMAMASSLEMIFYRSNLFQVALTSFTVEMVEVEEATAPEAAL